MASSPPSQRGSGPLTARPTTISIILKISVIVIDCLNTALALDMSFAPRKWETITKKPVAQAVVSPPNSHVVVETMPIDAEASAPRLPTMEASMNCIKIDDNWEMMAGILNCTVSMSCCPSDIGCPSCTSFKSLYDCLLLIGRKDKDYLNQGTYPDYGKIS